MAEPAEAKYQRLRDGQHLDSVLVANRAYLAVAVPEAPAGAGEHWVLTCLPATSAPRNGRRLSAVSMRWMETFVLYCPHASDKVLGFVNLRRSALEDGYGSLANARDTLDLEQIVEASYRDVRFDGCRATGTAEQLVHAFQEEEFAEAARALASSLLTSRTAYARFHSPWLTAAVLAEAGTAG